MKSLYDLSTELDGISALMVGLSNQLDNKKTDSLSPEYLGLALFAVAKYLERISSDLEIIDATREEKNDGNH